MLNYNHVAYEPIVGVKRKIGQTVFMAEIKVAPDELKDRVPEGFRIISDTAYVILAEAVLRDEKSENYEFINPIYNQYYEAGIVVKVDARGHEGYTYINRFYDKDWAIMESRIKGNDAFYAHIRTTRFPTEMVDYYYIQEGSRMKAVATDEGTKPISLGFDADKPVDGLNFDFIFANILGLRHVEHIVEGRKGQVICDDITREKISNIRYRDFWLGKDVELTFDDVAVKPFTYEVKKVYWFMMGFNDNGIEVL